MFDIDVAFDDIVISSMESKDIVTAQKWFVSQKDFNNFEKHNYREFGEFYKRFLESYVSEGEFFLKINKKDSFIGILKGRIEFKSTNEVWFWYFLTDYTLCDNNNNIDKKIIETIVDYFKINYGIKDFFAAIESNNKKIFDFWKKINYNIVRVSKDFFNINGKQFDMLILKNER